MIGLKQLRRMRHDQWVRPPELQANRTMQLCMHTALMNYTEAECMSSDVPVHALQSQLRIRCKQHFVIPAVWAKAGHIAQVDHRMLSRPLLVSQQHPGAAASLQPAGSCDFTMLCMEQRCAEALCLQ